MDNLVRKLQKSKDDYNPKYYNFYPLTVTLILTYIISNKRVKYIHGES